MFGKKKDDAPAKPMAPEEVYKLVKEGFDKEELSYKEDEEHMIIHSIFMGDDLPIKMSIVVDNMILRFICFLDFKASPNNFSNVAWELNCINKTLTFGAFYLDPDDGYVIFTDSFPFAESKLSTDFIMAYTRLIGQTVDKYDGDLKKIAENVPREMDAMFH